MVQPGGTGEQLLPEWPPLRHKEKLAEPWGRGYVCRLRKHTLVHAHTLLHNVHKFHMLPEVQTTSSLRELQT